MYRSTGYPRYPVVSIEKILGLPASGSFMDGMAGPSSSNGDAAAALMTDPSFFCVLPSSGSDGAESESTSATDAKANETAPPASKIPLAGSDWRLKFLHKVGVADAAVGSESSGNELDFAHGSMFRPQTTLSSGSVSGGVAGEGILSSSVAVVVRQASQVHPTPSLQ